LQAAFPVVNENEIAIKEKQDSVAKWKSKNGFDLLNKRENWNEHPKAPTLSERKELKIPYHE